jgi:quercetin dioxygenase-like cupin family protein
MRLFAWAALAACVSSAPALAAPLASPLTGPAEAPAAAPSDSVRIAMRQETLAPGGKLAEHRPTGERYLFVAAGRLKVSNLVTGEEQVVEAGKMAAERPGDWHVAEVLGTEPVSLYVIDRAPAEAVGTTASAAGN